MERPLGASKPSVPSESDRDVLWQAANAFRTTQALYVVAKLGIPDLLRDRPRTSEDLARRAKAHSRSLFRLLRYLAGIGFFTQDKSNRFGLTPRSEPLRTDAPNSMRPMVIFLGEDQYPATAGDAPSPAKQMDVTMLIMTGGHERSEEEWRTLLAGSGFSFGKVRRTSSPFDLIEANPV
jgi:hypothetical protein